MQPDDPAAKPTDTAELKRCPCCGAIIGCHVDPTYTLIDAARDAQINAARAAAGLAPLDVPPC